MKIAAVLLATTLFGSVAAAQDHLEPETGVFAGEEPSSGYEKDVRQVFAPAYAQGVILRVVILPSFSPESVVGLRETERGMEVFVLKPSCHIWNLEMLRDYESGRITCVDQDGTKIPLAKNESYQKLKQVTPSDISKVTTDTIAKPLPEPLAGEVALSERIKTVWKKVLLDTRYLKEPRDGNDGTNYYFSMFMPRRGDVSGQIWSPDEHTRMHDLTNLVSQLSFYANGKTNAHQLEKALQPLE